MIFARRAVIFLLIWVQGKGYKCLPRRRCISGSVANFLGVVKAWEIIPLALCLMAENERFSFETLECACFCQPI
jgi:hypothetical protein